MDYDTCTKDIHEINVGRNMDSYKFKADDYKNEIPHEECDSDNSEDVKIVKALNENAKEIVYDDTLFNIIDELEANDCNEQNYKPEVKNTHHESKRSKRTETEKIHRQKNNSTRKHKY